MTTKNKELVMLTGLPGCGKSTYRKPYLDVISSDQFIEAFAEMTGRTYNDVFQEMIKPAEENMYALMNQFIADGSKLIIWDQTNLTKKVRAKKLQKFNEAGGKDYRKISLFFEPDLQLSLSRNMARREAGRGVPAHVIETMFESIEVPKKSEGFDYVLHVPLDSQV